MNYEVIIVSQRNHSPSRDFLQYKLIRIRESVYVFAVCLWSRKVSWRQYALNHALVLILSDYFLKSGPMKILDPP